MTSLSDRDAYLEKLCNHSTRTNIIPIAYRDDFEIVFEHIKRDITGEAITYASNRLKNDYAFGLLIMPWSIDAVLQMNKRLLANRDFVLEILKIKGDMLSRFKQFADDREIALAASLSSPYGINYVSKKLRKDEQFVREVLDYQVIAFPFIDRKFFQDKKLVLDYITQNTHCMHRISSKFLKDKDIVMAIMRGYCYASPHLIGKSLKKDSDVFFAALSSYQEYYNYRGEENSPWHVFDWKVILNNQDYILRAIKISTGCYDNLDPHWKNDISVKYEAVYRGLSVEDRFDIAEKGLYFVARSREFITEDMWPIIKQALIYDLDQMLHPSAMLKVLTTDLEPSESLMIRASYILGQRLNSDTDSHNMDGIEF